jgi:hypothetical protein
LERKIWFDCDGTFIDLYGVNGWLEDLINYNPRPYLVAKPLVNLSVFARLLNNLQKRGYEVNIITWTSKNSTVEYHEAVKQAKLKWLKKHLSSVHWNNIYILKYGTPKSSCGNGILFDDEEKNRIDWNGIAYDEKNLLEKLKGIL